MVAPALILLAIGGPAVYSMFQRVGPHPPATLTVEVTGHSWGWEFHYPQAGVTSSEALHLPETALYTRLAVTNDELIVPLENRRGDVYILEGF